MPSLPTDILKDLTSTQVDIVKEISDALRQKVESKVDKTSDICTSRFEESFQNRLVLYHALNEQPLTKKTFEYTFARSMKACGKHATVIDDPTNPGKDVVVDGVNFSLKTEAARNIRRSAITISKLMEARWIRNCRSGQDFLDHVHSRIVPHLQQYDRILTLRAFKQGDTLVHYYLVEIPKDLLLACSQLTADAFRARTPNGSTSADVLKSSTRLFRLSLDGSVEKVTVRNLNVSLCKTHGEWKVPLRLDGS